MSDPPNAWEAADRAYQAHHFACPQCIAAGITRSQERCADGLALWQTYQQERDPRAQPKPLEVKPNANLRERRGDPAWRERA